VHGTTVQLGLFDVSKPGEVPVPVRAYPTDNAISLHRMMKEASLRSQHEGLAAATLAAQYQHRQPLASGYSLDLAEQSPYAAYGGQTG